MGEDLSAELTALAALGLLVLTMRWVFASPRRRRVRPVDAASASAELGLLSVVASGLSRADAQQQRAALGALEIRSSMSGRRDGSFDVLVFHGDVDRARDVLGG